MSAADVLVGGYFFLIIYVFIILPPRLCIFFFFLFSHVESITSVHGRWIIPKAFKASAKTTLPSGDASGKSWGAAFTARARKPLALHLGTD